MSAGDAPAAVPGAAGSRDRLAPARELRGAPTVAWWANPTMWIALAALLGWVVGWAGYLSGAVPAWAAIAVNVVANYLGFTVFHESCHRTAHRRRWLNDALGWLPALMLTFVSPVFRSCHLQHHAHTNDPDRDPDHWVAHRPRWLLPFWLVGTAVRYRVLCHRLGWSTPAARRAQQVMDAALVASLPVAALTGYLTEVVVLYWAPMLISGLVLFFAFDFLPHYPFDSTERFHDTRLQPGRLRHALLLGQNYHLVHHLWVSVPWFRYRQVFTDLEPELRARNVRID